MINKLQLTNFKGFGETQEVPLKPITIVFGANSAGKSSIIHSLLLIQEAMGKGDLDVHKTSAGGDSVDLGGFNNYVFGHNPESTVMLGYDFKFTGSEAATMMLHGLTSHSQMSPALGGFEQQAKELDVHLDLIIEKQPYSRSGPRLSRYDISLNGKDLMSLVRTAKKDPIQDRPIYEVKYLYHDHPFLNEGIEKYMEAKFLNLDLAELKKPRANEENPQSFLEQALDKCIEGEQVYCSHLLPDMLTNPLSFSGSDDSLGITKGDEVESIYQAIRKPYLGLIHTLLNRIASSMQIDCMHDGLLSYLGPQRMMPERHSHQMDKNNPNYKAGGAYAWEVLLKDSQLLEQVNEWMSSDVMQTPYELRVVDYHNKGQIENAISDLSELLLVPKRLSNQYELERRRMRGEDIDPDEEEHEYTAKDLEQTISLFVFPPGQEGDRFKELRLVDKKTNTEVSARDVGFGISRLIPVLVEAIGKKNQAVAIEEPESSLHPKLHQLLGDLFVQSAMNRGNRFILETHSEQLITRILRRIRESTLNKLPEDMPALKPDDVCLLFVEGTKRVPWFTSCSG